VQRSRIIANLYPAQESAHRFLVINWISIAIIFTRWNVLSANFLAAALSLVTSNPALVAPVNGTRICLFFSRYPFRFSCLLFWNF
jgi:hypothetical protein